VNIANWLYRTSLTHPGAPALMHGLKIKADYREFARRASAIASALQGKYSVSPGDRIALYMSNRTEYLEVLYGIWWAGAVAVPINAKLHVREAGWIIRDAQTTLTFVSGDSESKFREKSGLISVDSDNYLKLLDGPGLDRPCDRQDDDLAWIFYTSGTTGNPKGVMLTHGNLITVSVAYLGDVDSVDMEDAILYAAPISHGAGLYNFIHVLKAARHVVPQSHGFKPDEIADLAPKLKNVSMFAAPTMVRRLIESARTAGYGGEGIKTIVYGGGPMYQADILAALDQFGSRFVQIYGQGESPMAITSLARHWHEDRSNPRYLQRLSSVGVAQSVVEVQISGEDGKPLASGNIGEVEVRGPTVMKGYWNNPRATNDALQGGWLKTGDVGSMDEDGFLTLSDRSKDVIISGGSNIYPREVEEVLLQHKDVAEVSVIGRPHPDWGEEIVACITLEPGSALDKVALDALCLENIARFKRPKDYVQFEVLPKNNYGKILKKDLRKMIASENPNSKD